jgi:hypothetical protein
MRGLPLRFVHCEHWRVKLIAHPPLGCYTILFAMAIYLNLGGPHRRRGVNKPIFIIGMFLYLSCSTHFALEFVHFYKVLVSAMPYSSHGISEHLQNTAGVEGFANKTNAIIGADLLISVTNFMCELIIIYRLWVLWSKSY